LLFTEIISIFVEKIMDNTIEFLDERFYPRNNFYYVSVTTVLDDYPKGPAFLQWIKDVGNQAKMIAERAADSGKKVHNNIELLESGFEIEWDDKKFNEQEWLGLCRFIDFYKNYKPEIIAKEFTVYSDEYKFAGTLDLVCKINGETWLIDHKFTNAIYATNFLQLAAYRNAWEESGGEKIDKMGILHLKAKTRKEAKDKIQGNGWKLIEPDKTYEHLWDIFLAVYKIWKEENPKMMPKNRIYPAKLKL